MVKYGATRPDMSHNLRMEGYRRGDLVFDVIDAGPADGPVVVLLHGAFQQNTSWDSVMSRLTAEGYRCLAPNQRGYSPGARPTRRRDYRVSELADDVGALIDPSGAQAVHLVGYDSAPAWHGKSPKSFPNVSRRCRRCRCRTPLPS
jgi:pimeloyl-ACP methyl ester carboxylesterase